MTIEEYIKRSPTFSLMPFATVYVAISELIKEGLIEENKFEKIGENNVEISQPKPERKTCRGLHSAGDFHSNR